MSSLNRRAVLVYLCVTVSLAFVDHRVRREAYRDHVVTVYVPSVVAGNSGAPAKYRVLMPFLLDALTRRTDADPYLLFLGSELIFIFASLLMTHAYLRWWYPPAASTGGTLALAAFLPLTFTNSWAHPDTFPDLFFFTAGCLAVAARRDVLLAVILAIGVLNRETMGFVALLWLLVHRREWRQRASQFRAAGLLAICAIAYVGPRWIRGFEHYDMWMLPRNLDYLDVLPPGFDPFTRVAGFFGILLLAVPVWLAWRAFRNPESPPFFRSALLVAVAFVVVAILFAAIIETRVFTSVLPLLLPGAVAGFARPREQGRAA
jgi:hypothetical protein